MRRTIMAVLLMAAAARAVAGNEECWSRGYRDGWCDAKRRSGCAQLVTPRPTAPLPGQEACDERYVDGYVAGQKAALPPQAN